MPKFTRVPSNNSIQSWVLRLGLFQLTLVIPIADDWVVILDHTCQLGNQKCLVVLGIRLSHWRTLNRPLNFQDMTVLMIRVVDRSTGVLVEAQLREIQAKVGTIAVILSDQGSDLVNGAIQFSNTSSSVPQSEEPPIFDVNQLEHRVGEAKPLVLKDYSHASSHILKNSLEADLNWKGFISECGKTQPKVKQTIMGALAPPTQKVKGRYMNISEIIQWGTKMLRLLDGTAGELPAGIERAQLKAKYGWIEKYKSSLVEWQELHQLREVSLDAIRCLGYGSQSIDEITLKQSHYRNYASSQRMADQLKALAWSQCAKIPAGMSYPGSSEIIESLFGKYKEVHGQHSRGGFTKMVLAIGCSVATLSETLVRDALGKVREIDVRAWARDTIGATLGSIRRAALPGTKGAPN